LLPNGKVFVAGGWSSGAALSTCELYNHSTGICTATASLATGRVYHTATLLPDGKVLIVGGETEGGGNLSSCTLYAIPPGPVANFAAKPTSGTAPLKVQFNDASSGSPTTWIWNFGDGTFDFAASSCPMVHIFKTQGTYTVKLTAGNSEGSSSQTRVIVVQ
jgi:PKD repeat protein